MAGGFFVGLAGGTFPRLFVLLSVAGAAVVTPAGLGLGLGFTGVGFFVGLAGGTFPRLFVLLRAGCGIATAGEAGAAGAAAPLAWRRAVRAAS